MKFPTKDLKVYAFGGRDIGQHIRRFKEWVTRIGKELKCITYIRFSLFS